MAEVAAVARVEFNAGPVVSPDALVPLPLPFDTATSPIWTFVQHAADHVELTTYGVSYRVEHSHAVRDANIRQNDVLFVWGVLLADHRTQNAPGHCSRLIIAVAMTLQCSPTARQQRRKWHHGRSVYFRQLSFWKHEHSTYLGLLDG